MQIYKLYNLYATLTKKGGLLQRPIGIGNIEVMIPYIITLERTLSTYLKRRGEFESTRSNYIENTKMFTQEAMVELTKKNSEEITEFPDAPQFLESDKHQMEKVITPEDALAFYHVYEA